MYRMITVAAVTLVLAAGSANGQSHAPGQHRGHQPYASLEKRAIKALSEQQLADLRAGRGMRLALAAELNGYPGPKHVLEHAGALELRSDQRAKIEGLFKAMQIETIKAGATVIATEAGLDKLFASGRAEGKTLEAAMRRVGHAHMILRRTHLAYHLNTKAILTPEQVTLYNRLRGYTKSR